MNNCRQCGQPLGEDLVTCDHGRDFCDEDCMYDFYDESGDAPIDWDEQDRRAAQEERIEMWRNEY